MLAYLWIQLEDAGFPQGAASRVQPHQDHQREGLQQDPLHQVRIDIRYKV